MKLKTFIELLEDFDQEKEVDFFELSGLYDTVFLGVNEKQGKISITLKNVYKDSEKEKEIH